MTLLMRDQENQEIGLAKGIRAMVITLRDFNIADNVIVEKLQEQFGLTEEAARQYLAK